MTPTAFDDLRLRIALAAREVALDLGCIGTPEQDRIANAFKKFADLLEGNEP